MRARLVGVVVLVLSAFLGGCGEGDLSGGDRSFVDTAHAELRSVRLELAPLAACGDEVACLRRTGPALAGRADRALSTIEASDDIDDPCLREITEPVVSYLRAARSVGRVAGSGDVDATLAGSDRLRERGGEVLDRIAGCVEGIRGNPRFVAASALRDAFTGVSAAKAGLDDCGDAECLSDAGFALREAAEEGVAQLTALDTGPLPRCYAHAVRRATRALEAYSRAGFSLGLSDPNGAARALARAARFEGGVPRSLADC